MDMNLHGKKNGASKFKSEDIMYLPKYKEKIIKSTDYAQQEVSTKWI
jgi:hypothetical protein